MRFLDSAAAGGEQGSPRKVLSPAEALAALKRINAGHAAESRARKPLDELDLVDEVDDADLDPAIGKVIAELDAPAEPAESETPAQKRLAELRQLLKREPSDELLAKVRAAREAVEREAEAVAEAELDEQPVEQHVEPDSVAPARLVLVEQSIEQRDDEPDDAIVEAAVVEGPVAAIEDTDREAKLAALAQRIAERDEAAALLQGHSKRSRLRLRHIHSDPVLRELFREWERRQDRYEDYRHDFNQKARRALKENRGAKRRRDKGWSPLSDRELNAATPEERQRGRNARKNRDLRARCAADAAAKPRPRPRIAIVPADEHRAEVKRRNALLANWTATAGKGQVKLRGREREIMLTWIAYQTEAARGYGTGPAAFARALTNVLKRPITRQTAGDYLDRLAILEGVGGPWASGTEVVESLTFVHDAA